MPLFNYWNKYTHHQDKLDDATLSEIEGLFYRIYEAFRTNHREQLSSICTSKFSTKTQNKLFLNTNKVAIDIPILKSITNYKKRRKNFSVDILFSATTYTKNDKNTVHWHLKYLAANFNPNHVIGEDSTHTIIFKQRWFFVDTDQTLKVENIKGIYLKTQIQS